jgi:hypothetical protein
MESILQNILGRIHVATPIDDAIAICKSKLKKGVWETMSKKDQSTFVRLVKKIHKKNYDLYKYVMWGRIG